MDNNTVIVGGNRRQRGGDWAGAFNSLDEANLWASLNTNELFIGLRCTVSGVQYAWQGAAGGGWVANGDGPLPGRIFVTWGDSIDSYSMGVSYSTYAVYASGNALAYNAGVWGDTLEMILARFDSDVAAYRPTDVIFKGGTNNINSGVSALSALALAIQCISKIKEIFATPHVVLIPPIGNSYASEAQKYNDLLSNYCQQNNIDCFDAFADYINPLNGYWVAGSNSDALHPTKATSISAGSAYAAHLSKQTNSKWRFPKFNGICGGANSNPLCLADTNSDGVVDGFVKSGTIATWSKATDPTIFGSAQKTAVAAVDVSTAQFSTLTVSGLSGALRKYLCTANIKVADANGTAKYDLYWLPYIGAVASGKSWYIAKDGTENMSIRTATIIYAPEGTTQMKLLMSISKISGSSNTLSVFEGEVQVYDLGPA